MTDRVSKLVLYSLGIVVADKIRGSDQIHFYPIEDLPLVDGKLTEQKQTFNVSAKDAKGVERASNIESGVILTAKWLPDGVDNRITSPDVIKNETVKIYRYADTNDFYWSTVFREPSIRRLETVCYMYGNLPSGLQPFDKTSSYWCEVSTHDQHIHVHTSKSNGEPYEYDIILNTQSGSLTIKDDVGNFILFDSKAANIHAENTDGSFIDIKGPAIHIHAPESMKLTTNALTTETNTSEHTASTTTINSETTNNGSVTVNGPTIMNAGMSVKGGGGGASATIDGDMTMNGDIASQGNVDVNGSVQATGTIIGSNTHSH